MTNNETPNASDWGDDWDDWDVPSSPQSTEAEESGMTEPEDKDDWDVPSSSESGGFINRDDDDDWGSSSTNEDDDWGASRPSVKRSNEKWVGDTSSFTDTVNQNPIKETPPKTVELGKKTIGFIIAGVLVLLALLFLFLDNLSVNVKKNPAVTPSTNQGQVQTGTQQGASSNDNIAQGSVTIVEIPDTMNLNYSGSIYETNGMVMSKTKYVQGHQVLYCITIQAMIDSTAENINYYCNYASYTAVAVGDVVFVKYQQVDDGYISVNEIKK